MSRAVPAIARTLTLLSRVELALRHADTAITIAEEALMLARQTHEVLTEGRALAAMGHAQFTLRETQAARASFQAALAVFTKSGFTRDARETLTALAELFRARREGGDLAVATAYFDSAAATIDNARRRTGDDEIAVSFADEQTDVFGGWARAWLGRRDEVGVSRGALAALGAVERGRAQSLLELLRHEPNARQARIANAGGDLAAEADSLLASVRATHGAALSYLHAADTLFAWFVAPDGSVELMPPVAISTKELHRLVWSARSSFGADDSRSAELNPDELSVELDSTSTRSVPADALKKLADLLLPSDFISRVPAGTPIVIVPHGSIALVPFAALTPGGSRDPKLSSATLSNARPQRRRTRPRKTNSGCGTRCGMHHRLRHCAPPFTGASPRAILVAHLGTDPEPVRVLAPDAPTGLAALIMQCLAKEPADRPASANNIVDALDVLMTAQQSDGSAGIRSTPQSAPPPIAVPDIVRRDTPRARRVWIAVTALLVVPVAGFVAWSAYTPAPSTKNRVAIASVTVSATESVLTDAAHAVSDVLAAAVSGIDGVEVVSRDQIVRAETNAANVSSAELARK